jgi:hypothetical protein
VDALSYWVKKITLMNLMTLTYGLSGLSGCREAVMCRFEGPIRSLIYNPGACWVGGGGTPRPLATDIEGCNHYETTPFQPESAAAKLSGSCCG